MKQNAGRVGFKWTMASITSPTWPNVQRGSSSHIKYMTNKDLVLMKKSLCLIPKGSFTWNINWKIWYVAHLLASSKRQVDLFLIQYFCVEFMYRTWWCISLNLLFLWMNTLVYGKWCLSILISFSFSIILRKTVTNHKHYLWQSES